jgi:FSR family fosmidomycin resistance protein-like MFS transporter
VATREQAPDRPASSVNRAGLALTTSAHVVDDMYQGVVPALLPFLVAERHYSFAAVAGLMTAATVLSSVAQPLFGWWADRYERRWLIPAGITTAAVGVGLAGIFSNYTATWLAIALSGLGIAAFHPEAARSARQAAGDSNRAMAVFALGGNAGYALGPLIATPVLITTGVRGTPLLIIPAAVMAVILLARLGRALDRPLAAGHHTALPIGTDDWSSFARLSAVVIVRSIFFFGITTFLASYFVEHFATSKATGNTALTVFLVAGAAGTLLGGWLADRFDRMASIRLGFGLAIPSLAGFVLVDNTAAAFALVAVCGIACYLPFAVFVMLGQDYLPNRIGTASGLTVGLAVTVGGLFSPLFGWLADHSSLHAMFSVLIVVPAVALLLSFLLHDPARRSPDAAEVSAANPS